VRARQEAGPVPVAALLVSVILGTAPAASGGDVISRAAGSGVLDRGALAAKAELSQEIEQGKVVPQGNAGTDTQRSSQ
jgi:hypothetical protein